MVICACLHVEMNEIEIAKQLKVDNIKLKMGNLKTITLHGFRHSICVFLVSKI